MHIGTDYLFADHSIATRISWRSKLLYELCQWALWWGFDAGRCAGTIPHVCIAWRCYFRTPAITIGLYLEYPVQDFARPFSGVMVSVPGYSFRGLGINLMLGWPIGISFQTDAAPLFIGVGGNWSPPRCTTRP